tara:strand:- start:1573 stop:2157 length:585 start_codon:yes stop_codon:yes gene_type:complete
MKGLILLGTVLHTMYRGNPSLRQINLKSHFEAATKFKDNCNCPIQIGQTLLDLQNFVKSINTNEDILIIYCGHGVNGSWCIGISKDQLRIELSKINNKIWVISDSCISDSMNIVPHRPNTIFISAARIQGKDEYKSAFFTCDGGYLSTTFYNIYLHFYKNNTQFPDINELFNKIIQKYCYFSINDLHLPKLLKN